MRVGLVVGGSGRRECARRKRANSASLSLQVLRQRQGELEEVGEALLYGFVR